MKQDKWTQQLHDKLVEHEMAAPEGLWDDIKAALAQQQIARRARFVAMRRWAVAASLAALLLGGGYWRWSQKPAQGEEIRGMEALETVSSEAGGTKIPEGVRSVECGVRSEECGVRSEECGVRSENSSAADDIPPKVISLHTPHSTLLETPSQPDDQERSALPLCSEKNRPSVPSHSRVTIALYASNGFGSQNNSSRVMMSENMAANYGYTTSISERYHSARSRTPIYLAGMEERERHYQPVSFGLTVSYPLSDRFFVTTGAVYTKLRSDFTNLVYGQVTTNQQTLHYVGVPLAVGYQLWNHKGLKAYVTTGIQADWNVQADLKTVVGTQSINKDACQWSVNSSVGIQYDLLPQIGLYAEPGVKYYFDNGSGLDNFFKDKPTNFNLQVGLRINP